MKSAAASLEIPSWRPEREFTLSVKRGKVDGLRPSALIVGDLVDRHSEYHGGCLAVDVDSLPECGHEGRIAREVS